MFQIFFPIIVLELNLDHEDEPAYLNEACQIWFLPGFKILEFFFECFTGISCSMGIAMVSGSFRNLNTPMISIFRYFLCCNSYFEYEIGSFECIL